MLIVIFKPAWAEQENLDGAAGAITAALGGESAWITPDSLCDSLEILYAGAHLYRLGSVDTLTPELMEALNTDPLVSDWLFHKVA